MVHSMVRNVAAWAVACNERLAKNVSPTTRFTAKGKHRIVEKAAYFGRLLDHYRAFEMWEPFIDNGCALAVWLQEGVFAKSGSATARDILLCILGETGFTLKRGHKLKVCVDSLLDLIEKGDSKELAQKVPNLFAEPD